MKDKIMSNKELIVAIAVVLVFLATCSYAWLTIRKISDKTNVLRAGTLSLVLDDTTSGGIKLEKAVPISDEKGKTGTEYIFTLQNKGTKAASYTIYLDDVALEASETRMDDSKVKYQLTKNSNETVALLNTLSDKILDSGEIAGSTTNTYSLRVWIDSAAGNEVMGTILSKELRVEATQAGTKGTLTSGDAFDCDVNGDGTYDPETERFYYVSDMTNGITADSNTAVLIYYSNVSGGVALNSTTYAYDESKENWHGPVTAIKQLPTTSQWKTTLTNTTRQITTETGTTATSGGTLPTAFSYEGYAARLLTAQEVNVGCGFIVGTAKIGELSTKCKYLMENTKYSNASNKAYGEWLESPRTANSDTVWRVNGNYRSVDYDYASTAAYNGVRPTIEVAKTNIDY